MDNHSEMIKDTANALAARLNGSNLRALAVNLYGDTAKAGLLADVLHARASHVSHTSLHDLRRRLGLSYEVRHVVDVPSDADAAVHLSPGAGRLSVHHVPAGADVVIVPAGARIVQPKPQRQPRRKRTRVDISALPLSTEEARLILTWWCFSERRDDWPDWVKRPALAE